MPDWAAYAIGAVLGAVAGMGSGYLLLVWYLTRRHST